jgi:type II secretory pathway component PulM
LVAEAAAQELPDKQELQVMLATAVLVVLLVLVEALFITPAEAEAEYTFPELQVLEQDMAALAVEGLDVEIQHYH